MDGSHILIAPLAKAKQGTNKKKPAHHQQRQWRLWSKLHAAESTQIQTAIVMQRPCTHVKRHGRSEAPVGLASVTLGFR
jgi:hypothetical protein